MTHAELRAYRLRLGLSQSRLARLLDVEPDTVARWERDPAIPSARRASPLLTRALRDLERELTTTAPE